MTAPGEGGQALRARALSRSSPRHCHRDPSRCWSWSCRSTSHPARSLGCSSCWSHPSRRRNPHPNPRQPSCRSRSWPARRSAWSAPGLLRRRLPARRSGPGSCGAKGRPVQYRSPSYLCVCCFDQPSGCHSSVTNWMIRDCGRNAVIATCRWFMPAVYTSGIRGIPHVAAVPTALVHRHGPSAAACHRDRFRCIQSASQAPRKH